MKDSGHVVHTCHQAVYFGIDMMVAAGLAETNGSLLPDFCHRWADCLEVRGPIYKISYDLS